MKKDDDILQIFNEFTSPTKMAEEIIRLRKNQMPEKIPDIVTVYAVRQHCATGILAHFTLQYTEPKEARPADYLTLYQPVNEE